MWRGLTWIYEFIQRMCVCVCVNSTSGGGRSLATPAYQGRLALVSLPLGAAVNKIQSATLTLPSAQGRPLARLYPTFPRNRCSTDVWSHTKFQSSSSSSMIAGPAGPCTGRSKPLSFAKSKSIGWSHQNGRIGKPLLLTAPAQSSQIDRFMIKFATVCLRTPILWQYPLMDISKWWLSI